jgi:hypothetical protein
MRKRWLVAGLLVGVLAVGVTGGAALAQNATETPEASAEGETPHKSFAARVAERLGLSEEEVQNAFTEAHREMHDERVQAWLDKLVAEEAITQEQADAYIEWYRARPDDVPALLPFFGGHHSKARIIFGPGAHHFEHSFDGAPLFIEPALPDDAEEALNQALEWGMDLDGVEASVFSNLLHRND